MKGSAPQWSRWKWLGEVQERPGQGQGQGEGEQLADVTNLMITQSKKSVRRPFCVTYEKSGKRLCGARTRMSSIPVHVITARKHQSPYVIVVSHVHAAVEHDVLAPDGHQDAASADVLSRTCGGTLNVSSTVSLAS